MAVITAASLGATALIATGMTGCADMSGIAPAAAVRSAASLGLNTAEEATAAVDAEWWRAFGDDALSGLITEALANNPSLKVTQARLARAQSAVDVTRAADVPQVSGQVDITRQRYTETGLVPPPLAGAAVTNGTVQLAGSWELDFFGKNRAALNAALGTARAVQADGQAARLLLASQVARTYFNGLRLNEQVGLAQRTLAQRTETLKLVQDRVSAGLDTPLELRQSEGGLPEARLQFEALQEQIMLTRHALAALVGRPADVVAPVLLAQSAVKSMALPAFIPADLLGRRADVAAARWRIEAAAGNVANASVTRLFNWSSPKARHHWASTAAGSTAGASAVASPSDPAERTAATGAMPDISAQPVMPVAISAVAVTLAAVITAMRTDARHSPSWGSAPGVAPSLAWSAGTTAAVLELGHLDMFCGH